MAKPLASSEGAPPEGAAPPPHGLAFPGLAGEFPKFALFKRGLRKEAKPRLAGGAPAGQHSPWILAPGGLQGLCLRAKPHTRPLPYTLPNTSPWSNVFGNVFDNVFGNALFNG